jgi:hypothetical protein
MDQWGQDFVDAEVEGFFEFGPNNGGSFQFGYVVSFRQARMNRFRPPGKVGLQVLVFWRGADAAEEAGGSSSRFVTRSGALGPVAARS